MGQILEKGSKLHKQRLEYQDLLESKHDEDENSVFPNEMNQGDLFEVPDYMSSEILQERFKRTYEKKHKEMMEKLTSNGKKTVKSTKKARRWALLHVLWDISKPTYIYAGGYQLMTVLVQAFNPLAVKYLLQLLEKYPDEPIFKRGIGFAIALFLCSAVDGIAQERQKYLAFQSGILIRAATVASIYHHMLNLTSKGKQNLMMGETTNLVATDCQKLFEVCQEGHLIWSCPLSMVIVTVLLLLTLGPVTLVGMFTMFMLVPVVKKVVGRMMAIRRKRALHTDKRVETMTAMLQSIKFCKLNCYEEKFLKRIHDARKEEMVWVRRELAYLGLTMAMTVLTPVLACAVTFITYALTSGNLLSASDIFTSLLLFGVLRFPINYAGKLMGKAAQGLEACQRIADFLDREASVNNSLEDIKSNNADSADGSLVLIKNGSFTVGKISDETSSDEDEMFETDLSAVLNQTTFTLSGINISLKQSETLAVVGPVGSGKSTLLNALIGDVTSSTSTVSVHQNSAYASQTPFILNATVRDNILFGKCYEKDLYDDVLKACNLIPDLLQLGPARDLTEIGERGITLSGGQKARISIARCVYAQPKVALFDDVLSALDAATGKIIFENLFDSSGGRETLLSNSAVMLVTHAAHFLSRVDKILVLAKGEAKFTGSWEELLSVELHDSGAREVITSIRSSLQEKDESSEDDVSGKKVSLFAEVEEDTNKKDDHGTPIMTEEERDFGLSDWRTWIKWYQLAGGVTFTFVCILGLAIDRGFYVATELWLTLWTSAETESVEIFGQVFSAQNEGLSSQYKFIAYYAVILIISFAATIFRSQWIIQGGRRVSERLFYSMTTSIARAPMSYFETTPIGRILNRLTYDIEILDISLSTSMTVLMTASGWFITGLVIQISILPYNICVLVPIIAIYWYLLRYYRKSAVDLQRLDAVSRSPVQANLVEGFDGSSTIKVFRKIDYFENQFRKALDDNSSAMMNFMAAQRWLGVRFQVLGSLAVLFAAVFVVSNNNLLNLETGLIAMLIIWSSNFTISLSFFSQAVSESEAYLTSMERARDMSELSQESTYDTPEAAKPSLEWPSRGSLSFENVCFRYRKGLPLALKGLSFTANPGQRVGICGRTGAGKSTISVALFRLAELDSGNITLDGIDLATLGLEDVRGRKNGMAIIPQDPTLFSGSLRECLDPWGLSRDEEILDALVTVKVADAERRGLQALDDYVDEGGRNFSVGERQLLCLARAVLSKPKVLVLDEATASVDAETDVFIQNMIRSRFQGTTLLTIAHRLNTIMDYDAILVMDNGIVAEFGSPNELLKKEEGLFSALVDSTGKQSSSALRNMAK